MLFVDEDLVAVDKPAGLLSVPGRGDQHRDSAVVRMQATLGPLWVVHRLDMDTSGVLVFARCRESAAALGRAFEQRMAHKTYEAIVRGHPPADEGLIDLPLRLDWPHRPRQIVDPVGGKPSQTRYRRLRAQTPWPSTPRPGACAAQPSDPENAAARTRLQLEPLTGRSHQLRVHLWAIGCPIVGDRFYGDAPPEEGRLMLHAARLSLPHPGDGRAWTVQAPLPF